MVDILQNTLTGTTPLPPTPTGLQIPDSTGNNKTDIANLKNAVSQPSEMLNFQKAMQTAARVGYQERQSSELAKLPEQFDPTKVSGGTFASILGTLEQNRGGDVSKIYQSTLQGYYRAQEMNAQRLEFLEEIENNKKQFEEQMKLEKKKLKLLKKESEQDYKLAKADYDMKKKAFDLDYELEIRKQQLKEVSSSTYPNTGSNKVLYFGTSSAQSTGQGSDSSYKFYSPAYGDSKTTA